MNNLKIRASALSKIMTEPKLKSDKEAGNLGETAKSYIEELYLFNEYGYKEVVMTDEMLKGLLNEQESMEMIDAYFKDGLFREKNTKNFENDYFTGTPDIILTDCIEDIKNSFTLKTFFNAELSPNYYAQAQCYMNLTGVKKYRLIYTLQNNSDRHVLNQKMQFYYKFDCDESNEDYIKISQQIERNNNYDHIPLSKKVKVFEFEYDQAYIEKAIKQVEKCRNYYELLKQKGI